MLLKRLNNIITIPTILPSFGRRSEDSQLSPYPGYAVDPTGTETGYSDDWALYDLAADSTGHVRIGKSDARPFTP